MSSTATPGNVPADIKKVQADEAQLATDIATLAADDAAPPVVTPPPVAAPLVMGTVAPRTLTVGVPYSFQLSATGGVTPYTFSVNGLGGVATITGSTVSGTPPTTAGTNVMTWTVTDSTSPTKLTNTGPSVTFTTVAAVTPPPVVTPPPSGAVVPTINAGQSPVIKVPTGVLFNDTFQTPGTATLSPHWSPFWGRNGNAQSPNTLSTLSSLVTVTSAGVNMMVDGTAACGLICTAAAGQETPFTFSPSAAHPVFVEWKMFIPCNSSGQIYNWPGVWLVTPNVWNGEIDMMEGLGGEAISHFHMAEGASQGQLGPWSIIPNADNIIGFLWDNNGNGQMFVNGESVGNLRPAVVPAATLASTNGFMLVAENSGGVPGTEDGGPANNSAVLTLRYARVWQ